MATFGRRKASVEEIDLVLRNNNEVERVVDIARLNSREVSPRQIEKVIRGEGGTFEDLLEYYLPTEKDIEEKGDGGCCRTRTCDLIDVNDAL